MNPPLDPLECRIFGALLEKNLATPDHYPLSLNALKNACNQKSNRNPVMDLDDETVQSGLDSLRESGLVMRMSGGRTQKYGHLLKEKGDTLPREEAVMATLLLRGPQTLGEISSRTERMHRFNGVEEVEACLNALMKPRSLAFQTGEPTPWVIKLPVQPGRKEPRYAHLFMGEPDLSAEESAPPVARAGRLADEVAELRRELEQLREEFETFKTQFE